MELGFGGGVVAIVAVDERRCPLFSLDIVDIELDEVAHSLIKIYVRPNSNKNKNVKAD